MSKMSQPVYDPYWLLHQAASAAAGAAGALSGWFNDIVNKEAEFSIRDFLLLVFVGATIGVVALNIAPLLDVRADLAMPFACAAAAAHKYLFSVLYWFLKRFTGSGPP